MKEKYFMHFFMDFMEFSKTTKSSNQDVVEVQIFRLNLQIFFTKKTDADAVK